VIIVDILIKSGKNCIILIHPPSQYSNLIRKQIVFKTTNDKKYKEVVDMDSLRRLIKKLSSDIVDQKKNSGESSSYRRPWKPPFKRNSSPPNNTSTSLEKIHIEEFS
jgi:hypothetical protein